MTILSSTKEAFGGEVPFTNWLCSDLASDSINSLLVECFGLKRGNALHENITAESQTATAEGKRVDIVLRDDADNTVFATVECQDAGGWLDAMHASKSQYYAYDQGAMYNIVLCENSSEAMREYLRYETLHPEKRNYLVEYTIVRTEITAKPIIIWKAMIRAEDLKREQKKQDRIKQDRTGQTSLTDVFDNLPLSIHLNYKKRRIDAVIDTDGMVVMSNGAKFTSLSIAGKHAMDVINDGLGEPHVSGPNGWDWWKDDDERALDDYRST